MSKRHLDALLAKIMQIAIQDDPNLNKKMLFVIQLTSRVDSFYTQKNNQHT